MSIIYKIVMGTFFKRILKSLAYQLKRDYVLLWKKNLLVIYGTHSKEGILGGLINFD